MRRRGRGEYLYRCTYLRWVAPHLLISEGDVGGYVLLPGDPGRAERIAGFLENPRLVSRNREFVVITGGYRGIRVSAVSTGIGSPSTAIALEELARCGAKVFIRVGTCGALRRGIPIGALVVPYAAVRLDGVTKRYVAPEYPAVAHPAVFSALLRAAEEEGLSPVTGIVVSDDRFYVDREELLAWARLNAVAVEMEASTVMVLA
ncbi:MAG: hypothetical protein DRO39_08980, partial [Thermoprotei archaeon]